MRTRVMHAYKMLIDGQLVEGAKTIEVVNPATGEPFTTAPAADEAQLDAAVAAARRAFPAWAATSWEKRRDCLLQFAQRLEEEAEDFARLLVREQGKPLAEARFEIGATLQGIRYYAGAELPAGRELHIDAAIRMAATRSSVARSGSSPLSPRGTIPSFWLATNSVPPC